jgi:twitching motility two-component system response regulator PilH
MPPLEMLLLTGEARRMPMKVMIIDDEMDTRVYLAAFLEDKGYEACTLDGREGTIEAILRDRPDLIVLDIMMPRRSGISIYRDIRSDPRLAHMAVVIMTGMSRTEHSLENEFDQLAGNSLLEKPDGFIEKPVRLDEFVDLVTSALKIRGRHRPDVG